jgi:hypothetical protein
MKRSTLGASLMALLLTFSITSCKKDSNPGNGADSNLESAENNSMAESYYNDVTTLVDVAAYNGASMTFRTTEEQSPLSGCVTVTVDTVSVPRAITIDFGTSNCLCIDGRNRRGKILATYTGKYKDSNTVIAITFDNYFVNENQVKGTKTVTNKGRNTSGNLVYQVEVNGQLVKANGKGTITWISSRQREWKAGAATPLNILDDVYGITGTANGTNASGKAYAITITEVLVRKMNCRWFESGVVTLVPEGAPAVTLNYGNTGCDANAVVTINNKNYDIVLQ